MRISKYFTGYKAFTLAEVLITLAIIGVVAAIVIPGILNNTKDSELRTAFKKAFAEISQAFVKYKLDNGGSYTMNCPDFDNNCFRNTIKPYLNYVKDCANDVQAQGCFAKNPVFLDGTSIGAAVINTNGGIPPNVGSSLVLNNGATMYFRFHACEGNATYSIAFGNCGWIFVDVNGLKGPNKMGKDIYDLIFNDENISPASGKGGPGVVTPDKQPESTAGGCRGSAGQWAGASCGTYVLNGTF